MRCSKTAFGLLVMALAAAPLSSHAADLNPQKAAHTVSWYRQHQDQMKRVHALCTDDRTYENYPDCKNAAAAGDTMVSSPYGGDNLGDLNDPETYRRDPRWRKITLALCKTSTPPTAASCKAAQAAASSGIGTK